MALKEGFKTSPSKELLEGMLAPWTTKEGLISLIRNASSLNTNHTTEIMAQLKEISIPTLIIWGKEDKFQKVKFARKLNSDIPSSKLIEVEDARHWVMLDRPDVVYQELKNFLDSTEGHRVNRKQDFSSMYS